MAKGKQKQELVVVNDKLGLPAHLNDTNRLQIHRIEEQIRDKLRTIKIHFLEIGRLLSRAKRLLIHGTFQQWIEETFGNELSYQSAYQYKRIYELFCGALSPVDRLVDPYDDNEKVFSYKEIIFLENLQRMPLYFLIDLVENGFPPSARDMIYNNANILSKDIAKETSSNYKDYKKRIISEKKFINQTKKLIEDEKKLWVDMIQRQTPKGRAMAEKREKKRQEEKEKRKAGLRLLHAVEMTEKNIDKIWSYFVEVKKSGAFITEFQNKLIKRIDSMIKELQGHKEAISKARTLKL